MILRELNFPNYKNEKKFARIKFYEQQFSIPQVWPKFAIFNSPKNVFP